MLKIVVLLKRKDDVSHEEFCEYYERRHAPLFQRVIPDEVRAAIVHYAQNHTIKLGASSSEPDYDCITEMGFADLSGAKVWSDWYYSDAGQVLRDDEENFMDPRQRVVFVTDEKNLGAGH
jgi:uncharacterized protein (TIGR02118 family)